MGDDNGYGIILGAGIFIGVVGTLVVQFLFLHTRWIW